MFRRFFINMIRYYKQYISPRLPGACKYVPTCSTYAITAIERFGPLKGVGLALWRILRCNPFSKGGYDPVPEICNDTIRKE